MAPITDFNAGYEFATVRFQLRPQEVDLYLESVGETGALFSQQRYVPPTALAAFALRGVLLEIKLPAGALHSAQEISVTRPVTSSEAITFRAKLTRNLVRRGWRFVSIDYTGFDEEEQPVMQGKSTVVIPEAERGDDGQ